MEEERSYRAERRQSTSSSDFKTSGDCLAVIFRTVECCCLMDPFSTIANCRDPLSFPNQGKF